MPKHRPSAATAIALLALVLAVSSPAWGAPASSAASKAIKKIAGKQIASDAITSSKVKDGTLLPKDFKGGAAALTGRTGAAGARGPAGAAGVAGPAGPIGKTGATGPQGPSNAIVRKAATTLVTDAKDVISLALPPGSWVITARLNGANTATSPTRLECTLIDPAGDGLDFGKTRLAANNNAPGDLVFTTFTLVGATTTPGGGTARMTCGSTTPAPIELITLQMVAVQVGSLTSQ